MDFITALKSAVIDLFKSANRADALAVADVLSRWGLDFGYNQNGNVTDWKTIKGETQSRVSLTKYLDGTQGIVVNRMNALDAKHAFLSAVHGAILAWRRDAGAKDAKGRERLIDADFTALAGYIGLSKVADERTVIKDGKETKVKVSDTARRYWYGSSAALDKVIDAFVASAPEMPTGYVGTEERHVIGTTLLPAVATLANGTKAPVLVRIGSYTAAENAIAKGEAKSNTALDLFETYCANSSFEFNFKNKGYKMLTAFVKDRKVKADADAVAKAEAEEQPKPAKKAAKAA